MKILLSEVVLQFFTFFNAQKTVDSNGDVIAGRIGGELRRLSIAVEIVALPPLLILEVTLLAA